jgi:hypothetical protein
MESVSRRVQQGRRSHSVIAEMCFETRFFKKHGENVMWRTGLLIDGSQHFRIGICEIREKENSNIEARNPNGADGIRDIEGKVARAAARERGPRTSFKQCSNPLRGNDQS